MLLKQTTSSGLFSQSSSGVVQDTTEKESNSDHPNSKPEHSDNGGESADRGQNCRSSDLCPAAKQPRTV